MRTVLLAVCGLSPQVITETLFALHQQGRQIDAIRILTTREGKAACIANLFGTGDGQYYQYLTEYGISRNSIDFSPRHIHAVRDRDGREIDDINSEYENELFLEACMTRAFELTADSQTGVCFSLAGGRKTMSACLSLAAQCYGRKQDRIYHVLVTPEFERCRDFYFPPLKPRKLQTFTREHLPCVVSTADAQVSLVPLPFFPLRDQLPGDMLQAPESPAGLMLSLVREQAEELVLNLVDRTVTWKNTEREIKPALLAFYAFFAELKKKADCTKATCRSCCDCFVKLHEVVDRKNDILEIYKKVKTRNADVVGLQNLDDDRFREYKAKLKKEIMTYFGPYEGEKIMIQGDGDRFPSFGIALDRQKIKIIY